MLSVQASIIQGTRIHTCLNNVQETLANQQRVATLTTSITRAEDMLSTLRAQMRDNRSKGRELYKAQLCTSSTNKSQNTSVALTANISAEAQIPKQTETTNATPTKEDETVPTNVATGQKATTNLYEETAASIVQETHATEQKLAAQVHRRKLASRQ